jgi:polyhydroxyalkanoate synthesis repressor PhaR
MTENERHLIKKYANRKLYDTRTSRYITLEGISDLLRQGAEIQVVDRETGRDITSVTLSQIVTTEERRTEFETVGPRQERGQQLLTYVRDALNVPAVLVGQEVERRRGDLETIVDAAIERSLTRLSIPSRREVERLSRRVDELESKLGRLHTGGGANGKATPRRRAAAAKN